MERKWWHDKVAYQIYPKSFMDSNDDGIGDIQGIISKLDYLQDLGIDIVWISPMYCSPMVDQGYDISDYYNIDPRFGTMDDMELLIAEAKKRNIGIIMDLVVNHCSDEHVWFKKACEDPTGEYGKYFYIEDMKDGKVPCNWRGYFGGSVWEPLPGHPDKCYMHLFHKKQPDLNWENPKLRKEVFEMINWWLEKGIVGFRIDAIINIKKTFPFEDYEMDREDGLSSVQNMLQEAQGIGEFLGEMRDRCFKKYDAFTVGEVFNEKEEELPDYIGDNGYFSTMFDFNPTIFGASHKGWYDAKQPTPDDYRDCCFESQNRTENIGLLSNIIENHDEPRGVCRYLPEGELTEDGKKALATAMFMLKGLPFIYQGQEIGSENIEFSSIDEVDDINTLDEYQVALNADFSEREALDAVAKYSRDNARTPFQWSGKDNGGFTKGTPWLRVNPKYKEINLASQVNDPKSVFSYYKQLIRLRKNPRYKETLVYGVTVPVWTEEKNLMAFYRDGKEQTLLVVINFQKNARELVLEYPVKDIILTNQDVDFGGNQTVILQGYQAVVMEVDISR